jgi:hypothetical protein
MNRIDSIVGRYAASTALLRTGVEIISVGDPSGAAFDHAVRRLIAETRDEDPGPWEDLVGASKALRWRRMTQPQPVNENDALTGGCKELARQVLRLRGAVAQESILDALVLASDALLSSDSPIGDLATRSIGEVGTGNCAVVVASRPAREGVDRWLRVRGVRVLLASELEAELGEVDLVYAIGPPRFFPSAMVTAPVSGEITFIAPTWFADLAVPRSALSRYAERAVIVRARVSREGETEPIILESPAVAEEELQPAPIWALARRPDRHPGVTEVEARKILLSGGLALWLDDGDRIRAVDARQPAGERVIYVNVQEVSVGTYLLVRTGTTERRALYEAALGLLGPLASVVDESQSAWKLRLSEQLAVSGYHRVVRALTLAGVRTAERARAWTDPNLIRPHSDADFNATLTWLGIPTEPSFTYASRLRRALYQASADIREELERAVSRTDLDALDRVGSLRLEIETAGFRGILATRVLAVSPTTQIVPRSDARIPFEDRGARWLE